MPRINGGVHHAADDTSDGLLVQDTTQGYTWQVANEVFNDNYLSDIAGVEVRFS